MPQSLAQIYIHLIFSTKGHTGWLDQNITNELHQYIAAILNATQSPALAVGSSIDHIHILFSLTKNQPVCNIVEEIKKRSSKWLKTQNPDLADFSWQNGYGAFSVSPSQLQSVQKYILNQPVHHRRENFQDEYRRFLEKYQINFDERYVWD